MGSAGHQGREGPRFGREEITPGKRPCGSLLPARAGCLLIANTWASSRAWGRVHVLPDESYVCPTPDAPFLIKETRASYTRARGQLPQVGDPVAPPSVSAVTVLYISWNSGFSCISYCSVSCCIFGE
jgi:hypothetical protein